MSNLCHYLAYLLKVIEVSFCYIPDYPTHFKGLWLLQIIQFSYHIDNVNKTQLNSPFTL